MGGGTRRTNNPIPLRNDVLPALQDQCLFLSAVILRQQRVELFRCRRELANTRTHHFIRNRDVDVAYRAGDLRMAAAGQFRTAAGHNHREAVVLVRIRFGMFVSEDQRGVIEQVAIAFGDRFQL